MTYEEHKNSMADPMTEEWLDQLREQEECFYRGLFFVGVYNWKHYNSDECGTCLNMYKDHLCFFSVRPVREMLDLKSEEIIMMHGIQKWQESKLLINPKKDRTIERFHFHLIKDPTT